MSSHSSRDKVSYEEASEFPAQPITLLNLVLPRVYGSSPTTYTFGPYQTTENWGYCGVITLALAAAGVALKRKRMVGFFAIVTALSFLIMVGDLSIVGAWLYKFSTGIQQAAQTPEGHLSCWGWVCRAWRLTASTPWWRRSEREGTGGAP